MKLQLRFKIVNKKKVILDLFILIFDEFFKFEVHLFISNYIMKNMSYLIIFKNKIF